MNSHEIASVQQNIAPFAKFIGDLVKLTMDGNPVAGLHPKKYRQFYPFASLIILKTLFENNHPKE